MKYFQPAEFDDVDVITYKLQTHFMSYLQCDKNFGRSVLSSELQSVVPELYKQFDHLKLNHEMGRVFVTRPNDGLPIHQDGSCTIKKVFALNWPIFHYDQSIMSWYDVSNADPIIYNDPRYSPEIRTYSHATSIKKASLRLTSPHWVRIDLPHDIVNNHYLNRVIMSFRFVPEPYHLLTAD